MTGISFVVPVRNGAHLIRETVESIAAQADGRSMELIVVDDGSTDGTLAIVDCLRYELAAVIPVRVIRRHGTGAAAAINAGLDAARYPIVCQIDQDVCVQPGWMRSITAELSDRSVGAAQGWYATDSRASIWPRVMGLDLEQRYAAITGDTDHVCTGNAAYRRDAIRRVGMFDETMGYGYDNDMSYRLREAGYRLGFCREARALHKWREGGAGYFVQQYGLGYGRIDVVDRHRNRFAGDRVSPTMMMLHPIVLTAALLLVVMSAFAYAFDWPAVPLAAAAGALVAVLVIERLWAAASTVRRFGDRAAWLFPLVHLVRDLAWVTAIAVWLLRRLAGRPSRPSHSMQPRPAFAAVERRSVTNSL